MDRIEKENDNVIRWATISSLDNKEWQYIIFTPFYLFDECQPNVRGNFKKTSQVTTLDNWSCDMNRHLSIEEEEDDNEKDDKCDHSLEIRIEDLTGYLMCESPIELLKVGIFHGMIIAAPAIIGKDFKIRISTEYILYPNGPDNLYHRQKMWDEMITTKLKKEQEETRLCIVDDWLMIVHGLRNIDDWKWFLKEFELFGITTSRREMAIVIGPYFQLVDNGGGDDELETTLQYVNFLEHLKFVRHQMTSVGRRDEKDCFLKKIHLVPSSSELIHSEQLPIYPTSQLYVGEYLTRCENPLRISKSGIEIIVESGSIGRVLDRFFKNNENLRNVVIENCMNMSDLAPFLPDLGCPLSKTLSMDQNIQTIQLTTSDNDMEIDDDLIKRVLVTIDENKMKIMCFEKYSMSVADDDF